jgi:hypothetical protein
MKNNTLTFGLFGDAQRVANYLIANRMSFRFSAMRTDRPGYNVIFLWDADIDCARRFCETHAIAHVESSLEH